MKCNNDGLLMAGSTRSARLSKAAIAGNFRSSTGCLRAQFFDCGWIGEASPGPSYGDDLDDGTRAGIGNEFTQRNTTTINWNLMQRAKMRKKA